MLKLKKFRITVDGKPYSVTVEDIGEDTVQPLQTNKPDATMFSVTAAPAQPSLNSSSAQSSTAVDVNNGVPSPLGGIVKEVKVVVGQSVSDGDLVVILEAMKMKTNIFANRSGTVNTVHVKPGDAVDAGQTLISIS